MIFHGKNFLTLSTIGARGYGTAESSEPAPGLPRGHARDIIRT